MLRKSLAMLTTAACLTTSAAAAQDSAGANTEEQIFEIVMLGYGYFPEVAHAGPDWTIKFYNASDIPMAATAIDGSWSTGLVQPGGTYMLDMTGPDGTLMGREFDNSVLDVAEVADGLGLGGLVDAVAPVDVLTDQIAAYGWIESAAKAPSFLGDDGKPISDEQARAQYGEPNYDTDGDGDPDGYDHTAMFKAEKSSYGGMEQIGFMDTEYSDD